MTSAARARLITAVALVALGLFVVARPRGSVVTPGSTPQETIYAMLEAARQGDAAAWLNYYTGALGESLRRSAAEQGEARFAQALREANAPIKGIAVSDLSAAKLRVEFVYADRNEAQVFHLEKEGGRWKIARLEAAERVQTLVPYGSPVQ